MSTKSFADVPVGWIDLAVGEPIFLRRHLSTLPVEGLPETLLHSSRRYPDLGGHPLLIEQLQETFGPGRYVATCGGKQGVVAAMVAVKDFYKSATALDVWVPYWPSYPILGRQAGLSGFIPTLDERSPARKTKRNVQILTIPNNPDGDELDLPHLGTDIWDAAYASSVFGWSGFAPHFALVSVWSGSKLWGVPGLRIGWVRVDPEQIGKGLADQLADRAARYVEESTSGAPVVSQVLAAALLMSERENAVVRIGIQDRPLEHFLSRVRDFDWDLVRQLARQELLASGEAFRNVLGPHCAELRGLPACGRGMFAWFLPADQERFRTALQRARVAMVEGERCGVPGWWRASLGQPVEVVEEAVKKIAKELEK